MGDYRRGGMLVESAVDQAPPRPMTEDSLDVPWYKVTGQGVAAAFQQGMAGAPGAYDEMRSSRLSIAAAQLARATGHYPTYYAMPTGGEPIASIPETNAASYYHDLHQYRQAHPGFQADMGDTPDDLDATLHKQIAADSVTDQRAMSRQGALGNLIGGFPGGLTDPVQAALLAIMPEAEIPKLAGSSLLSLSTARGIGESALTMGEAAVLESPFTAQEREAQGKPALTEPEWWQSYGEAAAGGALFHGLGIGIGAGGAKAWSLLPEATRAKIVNLPTDLKTAIGLRAQTPPDESVPSLDAAINVLGRHGESELSSPYPSDDSDATSQHLTTLDGVASNLAHEPVPQSATWPTGADGKPKDAGAMSAAEMKAAGLNDAQIAAIHGGLVEQPPIGTKFGPDGVGITPSGAPFHLPGVAEGGAAPPVEAAAPGDMTAQDEADLVAQPQPIPEAAPEPDATAPDVPVEPPAPAPMPQVRPDVMEPIEQAAAADAAAPLGVEHLPDHILDPIAAAADEAPVTDGGARRIDLHPDEIDALREHGVGVSDGGLIGGDEVGRLQAERARRLAGGARAAPGEAVASAPAEPGPAAFEPPAAVPRKPLGRNELGSPADHGAPRVWHETSIRKADELVPTSTVQTDLGTMYLADHPDLALGQGANKGVSLEFDSAPIQAQVNTAKPALAHLYEQGQAEYVAHGNLNRQHVWQKALRAIRVAPDAVAGKVDRITFRRALAELEDRGWTKTPQADGSTIYARPDVAAEAPRPTPAEQDAREAAGLGDPVFPDVEREAKLWEPGGEAHQQLAESAWHDIRALEAESAALDAAAEARGAALDAEQRALAAVPPRPRGIVAFLREWLAGETEKKGISTLISAEEAMTQGVKRDSLFTKDKLSSKGKVIKGVIKPGIADVFNSKFGQMSRIERNRISLDMDHIDPKQWGLDFENGADRLSPAQIGKLIRLDLERDQPGADPSDLRGLDRHDPRYAAWADHQERSSQSEDRDITPEQNEARSHALRAAGERGVELHDDEVAAIGDKMIKYGLDPHAAIDDHINGLLAEAQERDFENVGFEPDHERGAEPGAAGGDRADEGAGLPPGDAGGGGEAGGQPVDQPGAAARGGEGGGAAGADGPETDLKPEGPPGLDLGEATDPNVAARARQERDLAAQQPLRGERATGTGQTDIMPEGLFGGAEAPKLTFDLGDGKPIEATPREIDAKLSAEEAGIAAARKCME